MTELRYLKNVAALGCNQNKGIGCGICTVVYPHGVLSSKTRKRS